MKLGFIKAALLGLALTATHASAQNTYVGAFSYNGGTYGEQLASDLMLPAQQFVRQFAIDVSGNCGLAAQILHTAPYQPAATTLISRTYSPIAGNGVRYLFSVNAGQGFSITGIRAYMNGVPYGYCHSMVYTDGGATIPVPQATTVQGTVTWISPIATGNGDTSIQIRLNNGYILNVEIVGSPSMKTPTRFNLRTVRYLSQLLNRPVQITGYLNGSQIQALVLSDL